MQQRVKLTYDDHASMPDDGQRYELVEGELRLTPAPSFGYQRRSGKLHLQLGNHVEQGRLGIVLYAPLDVILSPHNTLRPDLVYLDNSRLHLASQRGIEGPPTLVIEILSPSTREYDLTEKRELYARYGVPYYWVVDEDARCIDVHKLVGGTYRLLARASGPEAVSLPPFPGLALVPDALWD